MRTVDLFCGCGGMSYGFANAGFDICAAFDNWDLALGVYGENFAHDVHNLDLGDAIEAARFITQYKPEVIIGGPPCQDFSIAGKRKECKRANLTVSYAQIVSLTKPKIAVMENVYNIEKSESLRRAIQIFKSSGYGLTTRIIDASKTGVPQKRRRFFLVAALDVADEVFGAELDGNLSHDSMTVYEYFGESLGTEYYYAHPRNYKRRAVFSIHEPSTTIRRVNRPIPSTYKRHPADKADVSNGVRPLTTRERAQIQTFPDNFLLKGSAAQQEHLIANAVPVKLAEYVANAVRSTLDTMQSSRA
jgi:DNA (cytosine-5)-methyltransferase 1